MEMCVRCKHGHECPYMETSDMLHVFLEGDGEVERLKASIDILCEALEVRIHEVFEVSKKFHFDVDMIGCEGYEDASDWSDKDLQKWHVLVMGLYELAGNCKSKVGVRIPFKMFDVLVDVAERYLNVVEGGKVISPN